MEFQTFLWMILVGVFASTVVVVVLFIIVNKCIRWKAAKYVATSRNHTMSSYEFTNSYKLNGQEDIKPPLPPRDQFDTESMSDGYEEMPEIPEVKVETSSLQNPDHSDLPETHNNILDNNSISESYDDVDAPQKVQGSYEDVNSLPDYLDVDPAPLETEADSGSENYDDVDQLHNDTEDYDDVG